MPIRDLINALDPAPPAEVLEAANSLRYRDFLIVSLIVNRKEVMPDNWLYIHEPGVRVGRIQNFKNWSPLMVPDSSKTCLGMEYFVFENDDLWSSSDEELIALAKREIEQLGLVRSEEIEDGAAVRMPKPIPCMTAVGCNAWTTIRRYLATAMPNLQLVGRNGMHKYNNQDHSMMTALCAARNIMGAKHDLWAINTEPEYHEEKQETPPDSTAREVQAPGLMQNRHDRQSKSATPQARSRQFRGGKMSYSSLFTSKRRFTPAASFNPIVAGRRYERENSQENHSRKMSADRSVSSMGSMPSSAESVPAARASISSSAFCHSTAIYSFVTNGAVISRGISQGEFFFYYDEMFHAMNGVFFRDLLVGFSSATPLQYAIEYYAKYLRNQSALAGIVSLHRRFVFPCLGLSPWVSRLAVLSFALLAAYFWYRIAESSARNTRAFLSTLTIACVPFILLYERVTMLEIPSFATCMATIYFWMKFQDTGRRRDLWAVTGLATVSFLVSQKAIFLVLFFALYCLVERPYQVLKRVDVWLALFVSSLVVLPWYLSASKTFILFVGARRR